MSRQPRRQPARNNPDWWTPSRRAAAAASIGSEARERLAAQGRERWRAANPEKAAVRDRILEAEEPQPCDQCGDPVTTLWVTDYPTGAHLWRCKPCAKRGGAS